MKGIALIALTLALGLAGSGGGSADADGGASRHAAAWFHAPLLGISARVPAGWSTRHARRGARHLREDLSAASFPLRESPTLRAAACRSAAGVPPRPARFRLGRPGDEEGYYGFDLFFQDRRRALRAQVCLHRGSSFTERRRRQVERFLDSLRFSRPGSQLIGHGTAKLGCHGVFAGSGEPDWRRQASSVGPFGFAGAGRDFLRIPHRERDGLFHTKMPALIEGHRPVEVSVPPAERDRVGIEVVPARHPVERVVFTPCEDKPRTIWAAGLALRDRAPVTLAVRVGARVRVLRVGRVGRRRHPVRSIRIGGRRPKLVAGRGSLWALTCDCGCTARSRPSSDRILRIDPDGGRVIASRRLRRACDLVVGAKGVYAIDFWSGAVRRLDPETLRVSAEIKLRLPFELVPGDRAFLPIDAVEAGGALWVSTARGVLARVEPDLDRVAATVRVPFDAGGGITAGDGAIWTAQQLAGVYRVDPSRNRIAVRIRGASLHGSFAAGDIAFGGGAVFAAGTRVGRHDVATGRIALVRIDPASNRATALASLPRGAGSTLVYGAGALWVPRPDGTGVYRVDPATGKVNRGPRVDASAGLAVVAGRLWAASADGTLRSLPVAASARTGLRPGPLRREPRSVAAAGIRCGCRAGGGKA